MAELIDHGISDWEMIERGIKASTKPWLPTQDEFAKSCKPSLDEFGLPSVEIAYREAGSEAGKHPMSRRWKTPAVYFAASETGFSFLKSEPSIRSFPVFKKAYESICARIMSGEQLVIPETERIEKKAERVPTKSEQQKHLNQLKASLEF